MKKIVIHNRVDCCKQRLSNSTVTLLDANDIIGASYKIGDASSRVEIHISVKKFSTAYVSGIPPSDVRKVKIQLEGTNYLHMREVQVLDYRDVNVAQNRPATQSSNMTGPDAAAVAGRAVDGNLTTISHTNNQTGKWPSFVFKLGITLSPLTLCDNFLIHLQVLGGRWT